ncbi:Rdx family-domain-containing protein [Neohortaea acidophila]|uniref:Rdx family-domain-containing protein n=1 Tax=Neohortaea acidophila TaxID=245834 RepID=A0A6A6Q2B6_9PEZI|nr:Rdx family-domain-containing protein [Neohortaea acidophila]KAF2486540.1 Rdx family-domain-containing protein [Neohortaea acidophila]
MDSQQDIKLPRVAITFCTQCRWMLRAAYYAQELLSTFGTEIGEIALLPSTGGIFTIYLTYQDASSTTQSVAIWDRKTDGGFPETKVLKQKIRDFIQPEKNLGHSDTASRKAASDAAQKKTEAKDVAEPEKKTADDCQDCQ